MNPYLKAKRDQYDALRKQITGIQERAAKEIDPATNQVRSLTEQESTLVRSLGDQGEALFGEIEVLQAIETRNAAVDSAAGTLIAQDQAEQTRSVGSSTSATDRDPGHYRSTVDGGEHSFFVDMYRSRVMGDERAAVRLGEHSRSMAGIVNDGTHNRALDTQTEGVGTVPPKWLTDEFETLARQGRRIASAVRNIPLGDDPRPLTLPRQTVGTDGVVAEQAAENDPVPGTDAWDSDVHVVVPKPTTGKQTISRQMLDMSSPAIDQLIYGDLMEVYDDKVELKVATAILAAAGASITTFANEAAFKASNGGAAYDSIVDLEIAVRQARKRPGDLIWMNVRRWGEFKKLKDSTGRPLIPASTAGPMNVIGTGTANVDGQIEGLGIVASDGFGTTAYAEKYGVMKASDTVLFESNVLRFRFEEVSGPESIVLGIWGYTGVIVRQTPGAVGTQSKSVRAVTVTAA